MKNLVLIAILSLVSVKTFSADFKWCVATSAHQIEGHNYKSDWWHWELARGLEPSGRAADHWNRWYEDVGWMKTLGVDMYRFSIEWAKVEPEEGYFDENVLRHYRNLISELRRSSISPMVTLLHFTLPQWLAEKGGLEAEEFPVAFQKFAGIVHEHLGDLVEYWITFNEPMVLVAAGYVEGVFPPGYKREIQGMARPLSQILKAHALAYRALHKGGSSKVKVGMSFHLRWFQAQNPWNVLDNVAASLVAQVWNWTLSSALETGRLKARIFGLLRIDEEIKALKGTQDFLGLNYYSRDLVGFSLTKGLVRSTGPGELTDLQWEIYPEGLYKLIKEAHQRFPRLPIFVTENGLADHKDSKRSKFITSHLRAVERAKKEGAPVQGYCHWSLLDNFEWAEGFGPRFGLLEVDYQTFRRQPRPSFWEYARFIEASKIPELAP